MEEYKYTTKYNIGDNVFVIKHNQITKLGTFGKDVESCEIYITKIKGIIINNFGISYQVEYINEDFKEQNVFLQTETQELYNRFLELMEKKGDE